uniref:Uncharacterized protein n=1 Tax=Tanacetum cinerariifolium TaxID=118510 RepID=A0A6L2K723_TANCI|nr:hypothetical protein [Tanacetum cinerariifolium]
MMKGSDIGIQEKKTKLFNEWESYTLTVINASLTENNLHQQCKLFSRGNSSTQQWEHFFTSSGNISLLAVAKYTSSGNISSLTVAK